MNGFTPKGGGSLLDPSFSFKASPTGGSFLSGFSDMTKSQKMGMLAGGSQMLSGVMSIAGAGVDYANVMAVNKIMAGRSRAKQERSVREARSVGEKLRAQGATSAGYNALVRAASQIQAEESALQETLEVRRSEAKQKRTMSIIGGMFDIGIGAAQMGMS